MTTAENELKKRIFKEYEGYIKTGVLMVDFRIERFHNSLLEKKVYDATWDDDCLSSRPSLIKEFGTYYEDGSLKWGRPKGEAFDSFRIRRYRSVESVADLIGQSKPSHLIQKFCDYVVMSMYDTGDVSGPAPPDKITFTIYRIPLSLENKIEVKK